VSHAPYDSLNLGSHVGDDTAAVQTNRQRVAQGLSTKPVWLNQVHGTEVTWLDNTSPDGLTADGVCSLERGVACTIMVADCLPVLLSDSQGQVVAAAHAGWRGLAGHAGRGILDNTVRALRASGPPRRPNSGPGWGLALALKSLKSAPRWWRPSWRMASTPWA
jgi:YfiH family protein